MIGHLQPSFWWRWPADYVLTNAAEVVLAWAVAGTIIASIVRPRAPIRQA